MQEFCREDTEESRWVDAEMTVYADTSAAVIS